MKIRILFLAAALLSGACGTPATAPSFRTSATVVLTTGLNDRQQPVNAVEALSLDQERFHVFTQWNQLAPGEHTQLVRVLDGERKPVFSDAQRFTADNVSRSTVSSFQINRYLQQPGQWQVEVYLDNERFAQKGVKVLPAAN
ncbi:hypothetical protein [Plasticicumulans sp.]|uniref:hypothetical protein n=1 Tax=Plasticicumulans sp. TaxID=2307179 RepID=UPI002BC5330B|nr:hypothetical protein [Plasticicumulans sp.]HMV39344.1 hypothetical protein [Plasticicumulans sp.]HMW29593.1 hypothetical protein [Plasticicumulans sp.]HMW43260.1 hypothetical protein [Plasticicumulans sp.]HMX53947.1 hypothetical protein [Plasticicumulans sp.]HMZ10694.1 hypothetical protein [Plasticicumulans sp.]